MLILWLVPLTLGVIGILQAALNKEISASLGVASMTLIGSFVTLIFALFLYIAVKIAPGSFPDFFHLKAPLTHFKWWYFIPGLFGMLFVAGLPYGFYKMGAANFITGLIASQMLASVLWDLTIDHIPLTKMKILGMALALSSVLVLSWGSNS